MFLFYKIIVFNMRYGKVSNNFFFNKEKLKYVFLIFDVFFYKKESKEIVIFII